MMASMPIDSHGNQDLDEGEPVRRILAVSFDLT